MTPRASATAFSATLLLLLLAPALARPALSDEAELEDLRQDVEEDLEDFVALEDGRAVDEAYQRYQRVAGLVDLPRVAEPPVLRARPGQDTEDDEDYGEEAMQADQPVDNAPTARTPDPDRQPAAATPVSTIPQERQILESTTENSAISQRMRDVVMRVLQGTGRLSSDASDEPGVPLTRPFTIPAAMQDFQTAKWHSHYPSCGVPRNTDDTLWAGGNILHLLFDGMFGNSTPPARSSVAQAKLRLYKLSHGSATPPAVGPLCLPGQTAGEEDVVTSDGAEDQIGRDSSAATSSNNDPLKSIISLNVPDDRKVRVSIWWYTRALRKNKHGVVVEKRKLLDSRMVPLYGSSWTEWNVRPAADVWRESGRNFGLAVEVQDEDGGLLDAHQFFSGMNCTSQEASTAKPIPSIVESLFGQGTVLTNKDMFPVMDICTVETDVDTDERDDSVRGGAPCYSMFRYGLLPNGPDGSKQHAAGAGRTHALHARLRHQHQQHPFLHKLFGANPHNAVQDTVSRIIINNKHERSHSHR